MNFTELAKARYSCRKFSEAPVEKDKIEQIIEAGIASPTAVNKQPYKIWVMESEEAQKNISQITKYIFGAKLFFVVGSDKESAWIRKYDQRNFGDVDTSIVATHMMLAIHDLGLGTTWVGYFDAPKLQEMYPEMKGYNLVAIFPVGYPAHDAAASASHSSRKGIEEVVSYL